MLKKNKQKKQAIAKINKLSHEGRGIAHIDGKTIFIDGALPNETVRFEYTRQKSHFDEGEVLEVIEATSERVTPHCDHFMICGGCSLQHLNSEAQLKHKETAFLELLTHQTELTPNTLLPALQADTWGYRRKARIGVRHVSKKEKVLVGFRERNGRYVANLNHCKVLHPSIGEKITDISNMLYLLHARDSIPQIEVAVGDDGTAIIVRHLSELNEQDITLLKNFVDEHNLRLYLQPKGVDSITLCHPQNVDPLLHYHLPQHQLTLAFHPAQFIQVNHKMNQLMIDRALQLLDLRSDDTVLDLFCGIGNFSLPIAKYCQHVTGIEGDSTAIAQAKENARANQIHNCDFYVADLFEDSHNINWAKQKYSKILLDPPRAGAKEIFAYIPKWQPERIVYVSCHPATLVRDAKILYDLGYHLEAAGVMDMFPHTQHVEAISLFVRKK